MAIEVPALLTFAVVSVTIRSGRTAYHKIKTKYRRYKVQRKTKIERRRLGLPEEEVEDTASTITFPGQKKRFRLVRKIFKRKVKVSKTAQDKKASTGEDELMSVLYNHLDMGTRQSLLLHRKGSCSEIAGYALSRRLPIKHLQKFEAAKMPSYGTVSLYEEYTKYKLYEEELPALRNKQRRGGLADFRACWAEPPMSDLKRSGSDRSYASASSNTSCDTLAVTAGNTKSIYNDESTCGSVSSNEMSTANDFVDTNVDVSALVPDLIDLESVHEFSDYALYTPSLSSDTVAEDSVVLQSNVSVVSLVLESTDDLPSSTRPGVYTSSSANAELASYLQTFVDTYNLSKYVVPETESVLSLEQSETSILEAAEADQVDFDDESYTEIVELLVIEETTGTYSGDDAYETASERLNNVEVLDMERAITQSTTSTLFELIGEQENTVQPAFVNFTELSASRVLEVAASSSTSSSDNLTPYYSAEDDGSTLLIATAPEVASVEATEVEPRIVEISDEDDTTQIDTTMVAPELDVDFDFDYPLDLLEPSAVQLKKKISVLSRQPSVLSTRSATCKHHRHSSSRKHHHGSSKKHSHRSHRRKHHRKHDDKVQKASDDVDEMKKDMDATAVEHKKHRRHYHRSSHKHHRSSKSTRKHKSHKHHRDSSHDNKKNLDVAVVDAKTIAATNEQANRYMGEFAEFLYMYQIPV